MDLQRVVLSAIRHSVMQGNARHHAAQLAVLIIYIRLCIFCLSFISINMFPLSGPSELIIVSCTQVQHANIDLA